jgi:hypothetical protein
MAPALLVSVLLIASCGLVYELIAGTLASYLLGDSVTQFSTVIGSYLAAMGIGSWLSLYRALWPPAVTSSCWWAGRLLVDDSVRGFRAIGVPAGPTCSW